MASQAHAQHLGPVLVDARELVAAHGKLRTGKKGRQWALGGLNRAVVVMCAAAWEAYVEEVVKEAVIALKPQTGPVGSWAALNASVMSQIGRFNTPNSQNTRQLFTSSLGLPDVTHAWYWKNCTRAQAAKHLDDLLLTRHHVAHGVMPRPTVNNTYATWAPTLIERIAQRTDDAVRSYLVNALGVTPPW